MLIDQPLSTRLEHWIQFLDDDLRCGNTAQTLNGDNGVDALLV